MPHLRCTTLLSLAALAWIVAGCEAAMGGTGPGGAAGGVDPTDPDGRTPGGGGPGGGTCDGVMVDARPEPASVLIVLDRSGSMSETVDRWTPSVTSIEAVTAALDDRISFGLMLFSSDFDCRAGAMEVPPTVHGAEAIRGALAGDAYDATGGGTPTAATLDAARAALAAVAGRKYVLLVTDGAPNCNYELDERTCRCTSSDDDCYDASDCLDDVRSVAAVRALREAGISTFVVGYDTAMWADVMDRMAAEGGTSFTHHIQVIDGASLESALRDIGGSVASCSYDLIAPPGDVTYVRVTVDGATIDHESVRGDGSGWTVEGDRTITLLGHDCAAVQDGADHHISVAVECTPVII